VYSASKLIYPSIAIIGVVTFGVIGYVVVEGWGVFDALYMTIITITTVGYHEVHDLSQPGRVFSMALMLSGVGTMFYIFGVAAKAVLEGGLRDILGRKKLSKKIESLKNHYIICGFGRMGSIICNELSHNKAPYVVIEGDPEIVATMDADMLTLQGDATQDSVLKEAGIDRAKGLISVLSSDANNLYVVLSARGLNQNLRIVARASEEGAEQKLKRAGADSVVSPYFIGGLRIAHTLIKPAVVDFIEFATRSSNLELQMEEVRVPKNSKILHQSLHESGIGKNLGIIIVAIKRDEGEMEFNPTSSSKIETGDILIAMGETKQLKALEEYVKA
jgi:voltage-gated potassium channel